MKTRLTSTGFDMTSELEKYAAGKAAEMAKHIPHKYRATADCWIHFAQTKKKEAVLNTCTVAFRVRDTELKTEEATLHMYTALDIAAVQIGQQLDDYVASQNHVSVRTRLRRHHGGV